MPKGDKLIRAIMGSVSIQLEEYFAKHKKEMEGLRPLIERHGNLIRARARATSGVQVAALEKEMEFTEQAMRNHLLAIAIKLNATTWEKKA